MVVDSEELKKILLDFSNKILTEVKDKYKIDSSIIEENVYTKPIVRYNDNGIPISYDIGEPFKRKEISFVPLMNIKDSYSQEVSKIIDELIKIYGEDTRNELTNKLNHYIIFLSNSSVSLDINPEFLDMQLNHLIDSFNDRSTYCIKIFIEGIHIKEEPFTKKINLKNITLRRPNSIDYGEIQCDGSLEKLEKEQFEIFNKCTSIIELEITANQLFDYNVIVEKILDVFRLFRLGSPYCIIAKLYHKYFNYEHTTAPYTHYRLNERFYRLYIDDLGILNQYFNAIYDISPNNYVSTIHSKSPNFSYLDIAFKWYKDALFEYVGIDDPTYDERRDSVAMFAIATAITSLEALYSNNNLDLLKSLRTRGAILLSLYGLDYRQVEKDINIAYDIRSDVVHGERLALTKEHKRFLRNREKGNPISLIEFCKIILDYSRISILIFTQIGQSKTKNELLKEIDESMYDIVKRKAIKQTIDNCIIPANHFDNSYLYNRLLNN